nr:hypothetical protein HK105_000559 [Polyrhizophydium stewartii]
MATTCNACGGTGRIIPPGAKCNSCSGAGRVRERQSVIVDIPAGVEDGMRVRLAGKGDAPLEGDGANGDLYVVLSVGAHPVFKRDGANILLDVSVPLNIALLGGTVRVPTIDGDVELTIPAGTQPNDRKVLRRRGAPKITSARRGPADDGERGDQWVTLRVSMPHSLTDRQRQLIEEAFGPASTTTGSTNKDKAADAASSDKSDKPDEHGAHKHSGASAPS